jgi:anti-sigma B factor antagonist
MDGRVDSNTGDSLMEAFEELNDDGVYKIVFDMTDVEFMSSKGWWVLIQTQKACRRYNRGEVVLANVPQKILDSLDLVGMTHYFKVFDDVVSAVGYF